MPDFIKRDLMPTDGRLVSGFRRPNPRGYFIYNGVDFSKDFSWEFYRPKGFIGTSAEYWSGQHGNSAGGGIYGWILYNTIVWCPEAADMVDLTYRRIMDSNTRHLIIVKTSTDFKIYENGKLAYSKVHNGYINTVTVTKLGIGATGETTTDAYGVVTNPISQVRIYNYALTEPEIKALYNAGRPHKYRLPNRFKLNAAPKEWSLLSGDGIFNFSNVNNPFGVIRHNGGTYNPGGISIRKSDNLNGFNNVYHRLESAPRISDGIHMLRTSTYAYTVDIQVNNNAFWNLIKPNYYYEVKFKYRSNTAIKSMWSGILCDILPANLANAIIGVSVVVGSNLLDNYTRLEYFNRSSNKFSSDIEGSKLHTANGLFAFSQLKDSYSDFLPSDLADGGDRVWCEYQFLSIRELGCVAEYIPQGLSTTQWLDTSGQKNHLTATGTPELIYEEPLQEVLTGSGAPTAIPDAEGQEYYNTTTKKRYVAVGTSSTADWILTT